jgi:RNA polymerase sigma factor (sigma-70 family)
MVEMENESDAELLQRYVATEDQGSFAGIVTRHTNLVFSAAFRQLGSSDIASDISQLVFVALAQNASTLVRRLKPEGSLAGWLCRSAHFLCLNFRRDEYRRLLRERQAMDLLKTDADPGLEWTRVGPMLDEAMTNLSETDYDAIVMRYYNNQTFKEVGTSLGLNEDTAQKRVVRALEKLRKNLSGRGIQASAGSLSLLVSANALQSAPLGLAGSISAAAAIAGTVLPTSAMVAGTQSVIMTTLQKTLIGTCLAVTAGALLFESSRSSALEAKLVDASHNETAMLARVTKAAEQSAEIQSSLKLARERKEMLNQQSEELKKLRLEAQQGQKSAQRMTMLDNSNTVNGAESLAESWAKRALDLRQRIAAMPDAKIPEINLVTEQDWLDATKDPLQTEADILRAMSDIRTAGELKVASMLQKGLKKFSEANDGKFPSDLNQLLSYTDAPLDPGMLEKWEIISASKRPKKVLGGDWLIVQKERVDKEYDAYITIGEGGLDKTRYGSTSRMVLK